MGAKILIIDHNDSFTFNLVQLLEQAGATAVTVKTPKQVDQAGLDNFDGIVLSPGPGLPGDYPETAEVIRYCTKPAIRKPVLGVCLGFQAIVLYFGGKLLNLETVQHGRQVAIDILRPCPLLDNIASPMQAGLYHSWSMDQRVSVPELLITSYLNPLENYQDNQGFVGRQNVPMSLRHINLPVFGVQFHPESYMTGVGGQIIRNWLDIVVKAADIQALELQKPV